MIFLKIKHKPKTKGKKKRHKWKHTGEHRTKYLYETIDGNLTYYPLAWCSHYKGVLTKGLMHTHGIAKDFRKVMILNENKEHSAS